jgi:hypothetical protein
MENTEKKPEKQASAATAELTQTELDKVAGGGTASRVSLEPITIQKPIDKPSTPIIGG